MNVEKSTYEVNLSIKLHFKDVINKQITPMANQMQKKFDKVGKQLAIKIPKLKTPKIDTKSIEATEKKIKSSSNEMTSSLSKSSKNSQAKLRQLKGAISQTATKMDGIVSKHKAKYEDLYKIKGVNTGSVDALVEKSVGSDKKYQKLLGQLDTLNSKYDILKAKIKKPASADIDATKPVSKLDKLKEKLKMFGKSKISLLSSKNTDDGAESKATNAVKSKKTSIFSKIKTKISNKFTGDSEDGDTSNKTSVFGKLKSKGTSIFSKVKSKMFGGSKKAASNGNLGDSYDDASQGMDNFESKASGSSFRISDLFVKLGQKIKSAFSFIASTLDLSSVFGGIQDVIAGTIQQNGKFQESLANIQSNLALAFQPIADAILPLLNLLMSAIANATAYIASFIRGFFGVIGSASSSAKSAIGGIGTSAKESGEKASGGLAGFDKINNLNSGGSGGAGTSGMSSGIGNIAGSFKEIDSARKMGEQFRQMFDGLWAFIQKHQPLIIAAFAAIGTAMMTLFAAEKIGDMMSWIENVQTGFTALSDFMQSSVGEALFSPITLAIAALVLLMIYLYNTNDQVRASIDAAWAGIMLLFNEVVAQVQTLLVPTFELMGTVFNALWNDVIQPVGLLIAGIIKDIVDTAVSLWEQYGATTIEKIGEAINTTKDLFQNVWDNFLKPIFDNFFKVLQELWTDHLQPLIAQFGEFTWKLIGNASDIYNGFIAPIVGWISQNLGPVFSEFINGAVSGIGSFLGSIVDVAKNIIGVFTGIIDFIKNVLTGNWAGAWNNIKDIFKNIADGIGNVFKAPINFIIGCINGFIQGINKIKIPDWVPIVGGKGFSIPEIPKLKVGMDYVPSDNFPALLHKGEAVLTASQNSALRKAGGIQAAIGLLSQSPSLNNVNAASTQQNNADMTGLVSELVGAIKQLTAKNNDQYKGDFVVKMDKDTIAKVSISYILDYIRTHGELPFPVMV